MLLRRYHKKRNEIREIQEVKKEINLEGCTVKELREIAKNKGVVGYSDMIKSELIETLRGD